MILKTAAATHETKLEPGISMLNARRLSHRIRLSSGTCEATALSENGVYKAGALTPRPPWREPSPEELAVLNTAGPGAGSLGFVALVKIGPRFAQPLCSAGSQLGPEMSSSEIDTVMGTIPYTELSQALVRQFSDPNHEFRILGVCVRPPGRVTLTLDSTNKEYLGLHLDSWSRLPLRSRAEALNRLCVNIGTEPRALLFINLPVAAVLERLQKSESQYPTETAREFMRQFPDYPVVRLEVAPGEAYIAPTENIIHDADTLEQKSADVTFTMIGYIRPGLLSPRRR